MTVVPVGNYTITADGTFYVLGGVHGKGSVIRVAPETRRDTVLEELAARGWLEPASKTPTAPLPAAQLKVSNTVAETTREKLEEHSNRMSDHADRAGSEGRKQDRHK